MSDLEWYKKALDHFCNFIEQEIHPWYGSCDALHNGQCSECLKVLGQLKRTYGQYKAVEDVVNAALAFNKSLKVSKSELKRLSAQTEGMKALLELCKACDELERQRASASSGDS